MIITYQRAKSRDDFIIKIIIIIIVLGIVHMRCVWYAQRFCQQNTQLRENGSGVGVNSQKFKYI